MAKEAEDKKAAPPAVEDPLAAARARVEAMKARKAREAGPAEQAHEFDPEGNVIIRFADEPPEEEKKEEPPQESPPKAAEGSEELRQAREEIASLRSTIQQTMTSLATKPAAPQQITEIPEPSEEEFATAPKAAASKLVARGIQQMAARVVPVLRAIDEKAGKIAARVHRLEYDTVRAEDAETFDRLRPSIDQYFQSYPDEREREGAVAEVFYSLRGRHFNELVKEREAKATAERAKAQTMETVAAPRPPNGKAPKEPKTYKLTPDALRIARGLRLDPARYAQLLAGEKE